MSVLGDHDVGIVVSMPGFTSAAETEARTKEKRKITLIDVVRRTCPAPFLVAAEKPLR
jgi:hypothetical protein